MPSRRPRARAGCPWTRRWRTREPWPRRPSPPAARRGRARPGPSCPARRRRCAWRSTPSVETVAAGSSYLPLDFTNASQSRLPAEPATRTSRSSPGPPGIRSAAPPPGSRAVAAHPVTLAPGSTAHAWLVVSAAANYPAGQCHPVTASGLRVQAPGQAGVSYVPARVPGVRRDLAERRQHAGRPAGPARPGQARHGPVAAALPRARPGQPGSGGRPRGE